MIDLLGHFRSLSTLSLILSAFMAFPSNVPLAFPVASPSPSNGSIGGPRAAGTLVRKLDRGSLLGWADNSAMSDGAEEADDAPLPPAILPRSLGLPHPIPSTIHGRGPYRPEVAAIGRRNPPLRC